MQGWVARLVGRRSFWFSVLAVLFGTPLLRGLSQRGPPAQPPVLGAFPAFSVLDEQGARFTAADLHGRAFIANLLCASCGDAELGAATMRALQHRTRNLGDAVRLVSFSLGTDQAALRDIRRRYGGGQRWIFLTGIPAPAKALFGNSAMLLLVDGRLHIRGRYPTNGAEDVERVLRDSALVAAVP